MSVYPQFNLLRDAVPTIMPSILTGDFGNLAREVERLEAAGVNGFHLDVMDGNFVPNISFGIPIVEAMRRLTDLPLDVHLMIARPADLIEPFRKAGADHITFHVEAVERPRDVLEQIHNLGATAGLSLNPGTPVSSLAESIDLCELVLAMSVEAGFGGQAFNPIALTKLREIRELGGPDLLLQIDGGVNESTIGQCVEAGAQLLVVGSAILAEEDYTSVIRNLNRRMAETMAK
jgi:ribulose-phosphate 3-epimerase